MIFGEFQVTIDNPVILEVYESILSETSCKIWIDFRLTVDICDSTNSLILRYLTQDLLPTLIKVRCPSIETKHSVN